MDTQSAAEHVDKILDDTLNALDTPVEWEHSVSRESECVDDPRDLPYKTGSVNRRRAVMTVIAENRREEFISSVKQFWLDSGYSITTENTNSESLMTYATAPGDFRMSVGVKGEGQIFFGITTPCFELTDVAPPTSGPPYTGKQPPRPNVHSDYWST